MRVDHYTPRSFYVPRTFYIRFASGVLDANGRPNADLAHVFMHEYAHLVQDQTTIYAAIRFINQFDRLQDFRRLIVADNPSVPLNKDPRAAQTWSAFLDEVEPLAHASVNWLSGHLWAYEGHRIEKQRFTINGEVRDYPLPIVKFVDNQDGSTCEQPVGVRELLEGYALAVETMHSQRDHIEFSGDQFEYFAVDRILGKWGAIELEHIVTIAHWSLQDTFPAARLFELLDRLSSEAGLPPPEDLYDVLRDWAIEDGIERKVKQVLASVQQFVDHYSAAGRSDPLHLTLRWYRNVLSKNLQTLLDRDRRFPLDTFLCHRHETWDPVVVASLEEFLYQHPLPQADSEESGLVSFGASEEASEGVYILRGLRDLYRRIWYGSSLSSPCPFHEPCTAPQRDGVCLSSPWVKGSIQPYCPFGAASFYADAFRLGPRP